MRDLKDLVKDGIEEAFALRYHRNHKSQVAKILRAREARFGKPDRRLFKHAESYAIEVLGDRRYAPWLWVYAAMAGTFKEGWIPDNYYGRVVVPRINGLYGKASHLKLMAGFAFGSSLFPDVAYAVNGLLLGPERTPIGPAEIRSRLFGDSDRAVFKLDTSRQGKGVVFLSSDGFDAKRVASLGNGVFQSWIRQHPFFAAFTAGSVATLRLTTAVDDLGSVSLRACYLRLGRHADTHVQSKSHVRVPVDPKTGALSPEGWLTSWLPVTGHPDSKVAFAGLVVPSYAACADAVLNLHRRVPFVRCVGWDVTVAEDGAVRLMEWNGDHNDIKFSEATQGPCFADLGWETLWRPDSPRPRAPMADDAGKGNPCTTSAPFRRSSAIQ